MSANVYIIAGTKGGHNVPEADVRRRFERSLDNFFLNYRALADSWMFFDNSGGAPKTIAIQREGTMHIMKGHQFMQLTARYKEGE